MDYYYIILIILIFLVILIILFYEYNYYENFSILYSTNTNYKRQPRQRVIYNNGKKIFSNAIHSPPTTKEYSYSEPIYIVNKVITKDEKYVTEMNNNNDDNKYVTETNNNNNNNNNNDDDDDDDNYDKLEMNEKIDNEYSEENILKKIEERKVKEELEKVEKAKTQLIKKKTKEVDIIIDGITCSEKNGSTIIGFSNNNNTMYLSNDYGINWITKKLPKNNKWSKIYLLEVRQNKFKIILFGIEKNIYLSTNNGDFWNHISESKGYDLVYSENYNYIYISTNNGILINNNEGLISSDNIGCTDECSNIENYITNYDGIYKFRQINDENIKNKNITTIACNPDGNIIIFTINNEKIRVAKIKKEQEAKFINKKEEEKDKAKWKYQYKESEKNLENYEDEYGNIIWNVYDITDKNYDVNSIAVIEQIDKSKIIFGSNKFLYEYSYSKKSDKKLEDKQELISFDRLNYKCSANFPCPDIKKNIKLPNYLVSKLLVYKIGYIRSMYAIINKVYILYFDISYKKYIEKINIGNNFIKDLIITKNGNKGYLLLSNGKIYINNSLREFFNKNNNEKSKFNELKIKMNNTTE